MGALPVGVQNELTLGLGPTFQVLTGYNGGGAYCLLVGGDPPSPTGLAWPQDVQEAANLPVPLSGSPLCNEKEDIMGPTKLEWCGMLRGP